ncbi:MAG TPA: NAD(P)-binding domain-containing protein [Holophagaceae bacterium]|nr:NAD(P)-binding domain-containing protein [Holophagaceae bacterium]
MSDHEGLDLIIVGGGIGGVICLKYALDAGLRVLLLEREAGVGGIWRSLPAWQGIQSSKEEWTLGDIPIAGADQASILQNIEAWVGRFDLSPHIRLDSPVRSARPIEEGWRVETDSGVYQSRFLLAATGGHNRPFIPPVERTRSAIAEYHSTQLSDPALIRGKDVIVVGGGASAWDLLDLCCDHGADSVAWVHRSLKWMRPSLSSKNMGGGNRRLAQAQMLGLPVPVVNKLLNRRLRSKYLHLGLGQLIPDRDYDLDKDQSPPGRRSMLLNLAKIQRHRGEIEEIEGGEARLADGRRLKADIVLWGTGFEMDLGYLQVEPLSRLTRMEEAVRRCGSLFRALDAPNLFLLAPAILDTNVSAPWAYAHAAKSIMSHIKGREIFGTKVARTRAQYFNLVRFLATRDRQNYPWGKWKLRYLRLAFLWDGDKPMPLP